MNIEKFDKLEDETLEEYQVRLSNLKLIEGEDLDWEDIKELLSSEKHRDTVRIIDVLGFNIQPMLEQLLSIM